MYRWIFYSNETDENENDARQGDKEKDSRQPDPLFQSVSTIHKLIYHTLFMLFEMYYSCIHLLLQVIKFVLNDALIL